MSDASKTQFRAGPENPAIMHTFRERICYGCGEKDHFIKEFLLKGYAKISTNVRAAVVKAEMETETEDSVKKISWFVY